MVSVRHGTTDLLGVSRCFYHVTCPGDERKPIFRDNADNAFIESFNGKFRDECLNEHWFINVSDAQEKIGIWRDAYNHERPHSSLNHLSPYEFIKEHDSNLQEQRLNPNMAHTLGYDQHEGLGLK